MFKIKPSVKNGNHVKQVRQVIDSDDVKVFVIDPANDHYDSGSSGKRVEVWDGYDWHHEPTTVRFTFPGNWTSAIGSTSYGRITVTFIRKGIKPDK